MSEGLREFFLIGKFGVQVYGWLYNAEYRQQQRVQRVYIRRTEYRVGTLPYISDKSVKPLGCAECTPVHQKRLKFPYNSFQLCLDFSGTANYLARLKKKNWVTARRSTLPLSERLSSQIATFSFFRFGVGGVVAR